jgi:hypothetical protein
LNSRSYFLSKCYTTWATPRLFDFCFLDGVSCSLCQASLELLPSYFCLPSWGTTGLCHHTKLVFERFSLTFSWPDLESQLSSVCLNSKLMNCCEYFLKKYTHKQYNAPRIKFTKARLRIKLLVSRGSYTALSLVNFWLWTMLTHICSWDKINGSV